MIYAAQVTLLIFTFILASKDADAYTLFSFSDQVKVQKTLKRWHNKGAVIYFLITMITAAVVFFKSGWIEGLKVLPVSLLVRGSLYDLIFNSGAGLDKRHIGTTAFWDKQFSKIFGVNGAVKKLIVFILILIALNILNYAFR